MSDVVAMIHVKCDRPETVNRKWQNQQEIAQCLQLCRWSPLGPAWRLFNMTHFNSTWGARSRQHKHSHTHPGTQIFSESLLSCWTSLLFLKESHLFGNPEVGHGFNYWHSGED